MNKETLIQEAAKAAPPVSVSAFTGNEILIGLSIVYVLLQCAHLLWKWNKERKHDQSNRKRPQ